MAWRGDPMVVRENVGGWPAGACRARATRRGEGALGKVADRPREHARRAPRAGATTSNRLLLPVSGLAVKKREAVMDWARASGWLDEWPESVDSHRMDAEAA